VLQITLKAFPSSSPGCSNPGTYVPKNLNAEGVGEWLRRDLANSFRVLEVYPLEPESQGCSNPGLISQRFQRNPLNVAPGQFSLPRADYAVAAWQ